MKKLYASRKDAILDFYNEHPEELERKRNVMIYEELSWIPKSTIRTYKRTLQHQLLPIERYRKAIRNLFSIINFKMKPIQNLSKEEKKSLLLLKEFLNEG
jgi:hypothetical protein